MPPVILSRSGIQSVWQQCRVVMHACGVMKISSLAQPDSTIHRTSLCSLLIPFSPQLLRQVKEVRNPQSTYGDFLFFHDLLPRKSVSFLLYYILKASLEMAWSRVPLCSQNRFILKLLITGQWCTLHCIWSYSYTCFACIWWKLLWMWDVSKTSLGEEMRNFKSSLRARRTFLISFL